MDIKYESQNVHQALAHLMEEMGEAMAAAGKTARFGFNSYNPEEGSDGEFNAHWLLRELRDVEIATDVLRAFLKASYNDDTNTWSYEIPN